jgi:hypothetical protein
MTTETLTHTVNPPVSPAELPALEVKPGQDILNLVSDSLPDETWVHNDDLCDCTFQRIGFWTNPYIARTMKVRLCCLWAELAKDYPQFIQETAAFTHYGENDKLYPEPWKWNGEADMPRALWYRQLAVKYGMSLEVIRDLYSEKEPPKGKPHASRARHETVQPSSALDNARQVLAKYK